MDPGSGETTFLIELEDNEAAFSLCLCEFSERREELYLAVGTLKDLKLDPRTMSSGYIHIYKFVQDNKALQLVHKTQVEDVVLAMAPYKNKLLAGVGRNLRVYDLGKKKLLRKSENRSFPTAIQQIMIRDDRIFVADLSEGFLCVKMKKTDQSLFVFADSLAPRFMTAACIVDYDTAVGGDKFGNIFIARLPSDVQEEGGDDSLGAKWGYNMGGQPINKFGDVANFHVGEAVTSIQRCSLVQGGNEVLVYSTLMGSIGVLMPFTNREDVDFFTHLEMHLRQEHPPLLGRDHLGFRSYYFPVKDVLDGDLCEQYNGLDYDKQKSIADELVSNPADVAKKLEDMRNRVL